MRKIICWIRTLKDTLTRWFYTADFNSWVDGHEYEESKPFRTKYGVATRLKCKVCGKY